MYGYMHKYIYVDIHIYILYREIYCASYTMYGLERTRNPSSQLITYPTRLCLTRLQDEEKVEQEPQEEEVHSAKEAGVEKWSLGQKETWTNCIEVHPPKQGEWSWTNNYTIVCFQVCKCTVSWIMIESKRFSCLSILYSSTLLWIVVESNGRLGQKSVLYRIWWLTSIVFEDSG